MVFVVFSCFLLPSDASSATYYVASSGNDSDTGAAGTPWRTIQKCVNTLSAGDTCVVADGAYAEDVIVSRSGSSGEGLSIRAQTPLGASIAGRVSVTGNYVTVEGFRIVMNNGGTIGMSMTGSYSEVSKNLITTVSTTLGINNVALSVSGSRNRAIDNRMERTCFGISVSGSHHVVEHNDISALKLNGSCGDVDYIRFFGPGHIFRGNSLHGINKAETGPAHVDCFQTFDNNGLQNAITDVLIEGNSCSQASQGVILSASSYRQSRGVVIRNNVFRAIGAWCVLNSDVGEVRVFNNTCDTTGALHGMWCRGTNGTASCEFKNNILYGSGTLYGVMETATLIDGDSARPGKGNLLYRPGATITGYPDDIKNLDPAFVDRTGGDYRILPSSPATDAALTISGWAAPTDKDGVPRPQGASWDIGAFEAYASPAPPTSVQVVP